MKKFLVLILVLLFVLAATACSKSDSNKSQENISTKDEISTITETDDNKEDNTESVVREEPTIDQDEMLRVGTVNGNVYENEFIGIGYKADDGWHYMSNKDLMQLNDVVKESVGEDYAAIMSQVPIFMDMCVSSLDESANVNVNLEKVDNDELEKLRITDIYKVGVLFLKEKYKEEGCTYFDYSVSDINIDDVSFPCLLMDVEVDEIAYTQCLISMKCNGYIASVTFTAPTLEAIKSMINNLYLL